MDFTEPSDYHNPELANVANKQIYLISIAIVLIIAIIAFI